MYCTLIRVKGDRFGNFLLYFQPHGFVFLLVRLLLVVLPLTRLLLFVLKYVPCIRTSLLKFLVELTGLKGF